MVAAQESEGEEEEKEEEEEEEEENEAEEEILPMEDRKTQAAIIQRAIVSTENRVGVGVWARVGRHGLGRSRSSWFELG